MPAPGSGGMKWEEALGIDTASQAKERIEQHFAQKQQDSIDADQANESEVHIKYEEVFNAAREDLNFLAALAMSTVFQYLYPSLFIAAWNLMRDTVAKTRDFTQLVLGIPRGFGKTTLVKLFILYCILFTNRKFILVISSTSSLAENI